MAIPLRFQLLILLLILIFISLFISTATTLDNASVPSISPSSTVFQKSHTYFPTLFVIILLTLGFQELSTANLSAIKTSYHLCPRLSSLARHALSLSSFKKLSIPCLYPLYFLHFLAFGTKIETLAPNRCIKILHLHICWAP
ncbi:Uncharacterized protein Adt_06392 [Abeliophyllum distichum]|uniref:Transmembrane protein n=1 Tax=Abeliophyllum distichum TaxID=126358 RepID=A0ABD1V6S9_9LAMI